jgi:predicted Fe-Mo cluster-binding NifX family protein
MLVAVPIWNGRVSPVFDTATRLIVVDMGGEAGGERREYQVSGAGPSRRIALLTELGVSTLICGAVSNGTARLVERAGIDIVPWVSGDVEDVLEAFGAGSLGGDAFRMPGCRRRRQRRCGGRGRGQRRGDGQRSGMRRETAGTSNFDTGAGGAVGGWITEKRRKRE